MRFSVLIPSYGEKERLFNLLKTIIQDELYSKIEKIVVVSPDKRLILPKSKKIVLIREKKRRGKYFAINLGLKRIKSKIVVMLSSDLVMRKNFLKLLLKHFKDRKTGMVVGRPKADKNSKIYPLSKIVWDLHHLLCLKEPKGTEICAFRKIFNCLPKVSADEVFIEHEIRKNGLLVVYEPRAYGYTKTPYSTIHFLKQRERAFLGHLFIKKRFLFDASSVKIKNLLRLLFWYLCSIKNITQLFEFLVLLHLELIARICAFFEFALFRKDKIIW
jgi:cellulose synthase/poly-beta-1,6-N-acetylglucosamine synthase-like glycosyltransferase